MSRLLAYAAVTGLLNSGLSLILSTKSEVRKDAYTDSLPANDERRLLLSHEADTKPYEQLSYLKSLLLTLSKESQSLIFQALPPLRYRQHRVWSDTSVLDDILQPQVWHEGRQTGFSFLRDQHLVVGLKPFCFFHCSSHRSYQDYGLHPCPCIDRTRTDTATEYLNFLLWHC
jgi:hypothetical protein